MRIVSCLEPYLRATCLLGLGLLAACSSTNVAFEAGQGTSDVDLRILASVAERSCETQLSDVGKVRFTVSRKDKRLTRLDLESRHSGNRLSHRSVELPLNIASLCLALEIETAAEDDAEDTPSMTIRKSIEGDLMGDPPKIIEEALKPLFKLSVDGKELHSGDLPIELPLVEGSDLEVVIEDLGPNKYHFMPIYPRPVRDDGQPLRIPYEIDGDEVCSRAETFFEAYKQAATTKEEDKAEEEFCALWEHIPEYHQDCKSQGLRRFANFEKELCSHD